MRFIRGILLPALLAWSPFAAAKKDNPGVELTTFDGELWNIFYFDDSEVAVLAEADTGKVWRSDNAGKDWKEQKDLRSVGIVKNPFDRKVAVALGEQSRHWITHDQGETWKAFETEIGPSWVTGMPISFHAHDSKKLLFNTAEDCMFAPCLGKTLYTEDGFATKPKLLRADRKMCMWAKGAEKFLDDSDSKDTHDTRVLCITRGKFSDYPKDFRLLMSDNYFEDEEEPVMSSGRTVQGMTNMASVKSYIVAAAKSDHSKELALYVTSDTETWHRAEFGDGKVEEDAYTILESTDYSIQVDVMTSSHAWVGSLYTSNSNGTYFTRNVDHTNRNRDGFVDFEKITNIQGIFLVNVVDNFDKIDSPNAKKKLKSRISFDDGRSFEKLTVKGEKDKELHLHSVTGPHNSGRVFSSPAPGIVMGIGNTGSSLGKYEDGDLYVSDDAGLTWELALTEAHKYEIGDQGSVLVAVYDEGDTDKIMYSLKHGKPKTWEAIKLDYKIRARELTTVPDSTSLKFILYGTKSKKGGGRENVVVHLDFSELNEGKCKDGDFEDWNARVDDDGKAICIMGHEQSFRRRKWDADCFVADDFKDPVPKSTPCDCDEVRDYECDFNFTPSGEGKDKKCTPSGALKLPDGACKDGKDKYMGSSGWRKIPGNQCKGETSKDKQTERDCGEASKPPPAAEGIKSEITEFSGSEFREHYYLEKSSQDDDKDKMKGDETVVFLTREREAWISHDHGKTWKRVVDDEIVSIYPHPHNNDHVFFVTASKKVYYSKDRALNEKSIHSFEAPQMPNIEMRQIMQFHPQHSDWIIWMGGQHCEKGGDKDCHTVASVSQNNGYDGSWQPLLPYVKKCAFVWRQAGRQVSEQLVFCEQYTNEAVGQPIELITSEDWFKNKEVKFKSVVEFATMSEFIVVATKGDDGKSLKLDASLDGSTFADAQFPPKFHVDHQTAYTVLESSTHSMFLHVTVNGREGQEYGSIIKSNSNGTSYIMSINGVNRNTMGYVDFEKMQGIEGVAVVNVVSNIDKVDSGEKKLKKTLITHNDGADWAPLQAPAQNWDNKKYDCDVSDTNKCSLHLHGYTERVDPRETYSSPTAVGLVMGVGNVGEHLDTVGESYTYISTDAGITWREIKKGNYAWEFGDQGSVIVIVRRGKDVKNLFYSLDYGVTWNEYQFSDHAIAVEAITTVPSDTSLNFLIWGKGSTKLVTVNVDFSRLDGLLRKCELDEKNPTAGDYEFWSPQHPLSDNQCLFGHVAQYHRRKRDAKCYNGQRIEILHNITQSCACTRRDYECNYNFERMPGGECQQIAGLELPDPKAACEQGAREWWEVTPYRKIPISTCAGGNEMDHTSTPHPCPGFEDEFERKHGLGGFGLFLAVVLPFLAAGGIGYYVWRNWDGKFGRIRLGEGGSDSPWISWPVAVISGLVAVVAAVPLLVGSLWRTVATRFGGYGGRTYTSRSSFARGRGDYAVVDPDEGELLGEDSDEDV
ncbi:vacuolar protein sorting/targeting protein 10 [Massariosphaeria phaeospora]|uniref:Vacuolar protein sorting/targeting protein 10 n=1 Tax=Massariosphaeria phaeospora TaxID=100035 RepID=A0A7C8M5Q3_9PLEO|nr:vacuolar protein sorting/targeting protein 10 [Massariosphaeria phaeospora]